MRRVQLARVQHDVRRRVVDGRAVHPNAVGQIERLEMLPDRAVGAARVPDVIAHEYALARTGVVGRLLEELGDVGNVALRLATFLVDRD
jgi:hypothetical protein